MTRPEAADLRGSLRRMGDTALALLQTRLELFNTELQGGALAVLEALLQGAAALVLLLLGLACAIGLAVLVSPPDARPWVLGGATVALVGAGVWLLRQARASLVRPGGPFAASLQELRRDREHLATDRE